MRYNSLSCEERWYVICIKKYIIIVMVLVYHSVWGNKCYGLQLLSLFCHAHLIYQFEAHCRHNEYDVKAHPVMSNCNYTEWLRKLVSWVTQESGQLRDSGKYSAEWLRKVVSWVTQESGQLSDSGKWPAEWLRKVVSWVNLESGQMRIEMKSVNRLLWERNEWFINMFILTETRCH